MNQKHPDWPTLQGCCKEYVRTCMHTHTLIHWALQDDFMMLVCLRCIILNLLQLDMCTVSYEPLQKLHVYQEHKHFETISRMSYFILDWKHLKQKKAFLISEDFWNSYFTKFWKYWDCFGNTRKGHDPAASPLEPETSLGGGLNHKYLAWYSAEPKSLHYFL